MRWLRKNDETWRKVESNARSAVAKMCIAQGKIKFAHIDWTGKRHTQVSKQKISISNKGKGLGQLNSQYNTCWIYSPKKQKTIKIPKSKLEEYIDEGWIKGRKLKFK